jgi:hypothetical protein
MGIQWYSMTAHQTPYEPCRKACWSIDDWAAFPSLPHVRSFHPHCRFTLIYSLVNNPGTRFATSDSWLPRWRTLPELLRSHSRVIWVAPPYSRWPVHPAMNPGSEEKHAVAEAGLCCSSAGSGDGRANHGSGWNCAKGSHPCKDSKRRAAPTGTYSGPVTSVLPTFL